MTHVKIKDDLIPVLPLRDVVVYPHMVIPLFVGRGMSIDALDAAIKQDKQVLLIAQKQADIDEPEFDDLYKVGTLANILQNIGQRSDLIQIIEFRFVNIGLLLGY